MIHKSQQSPTLSNQVRPTHCIVKFLSSSYCYGWHCKNEVSAGALPMTPTSALSSFVTICNWNFCDKHYHTESQTVHVQEITLVWVESNTFRKYVSKLIQMALCNIYFWISMSQSAIRINIVILSLFLTNGTCYFLIFVKFIEKHTWQHYFYCNTRAQWN